MRSLAPFGSDGRDYRLAMSIEKINPPELVEPLGYLDFLSLLADAGAVLTDSGGIQEETTYLGIPCLTLRPNTERPVTVDQGTNTIVGLDRVQILAALNDVLKSGGKCGRVPELWDDKAAERIKLIVNAWLQQQRAPLVAAGY